MRLVDHRGINAVVFVKRLPAAKVLVRSKKGFAEIIGLIPACKSYYVHFLYEDSFEACATTTGRISSRTGKRLWMCGEEDVRSLTKKELRALALIRQVKGL